MDKSSNRLFCDVMTHSCPNDGLTKPTLQIDMDPQLHPIVYLGVITYPCPNPDANLAVNKSGAISYSSYLRTEMF